MKQSTLTCITIVFTFLFFGFCILNPYFCSQSVRQSLDICARSLVPSLFPFLVLSTFLGKLKGFRKVPFNFVLSKFFGFDPFLNLICFLGLFFGFPSGACAISEAYKQNKCSKCEAELAIAFSNNCSFPFLINVVGATVFGSLKTGYLLFVSQTLSVITVCFILRKVYLQKSLYTLAGCNTQNTPSGFSTHIQNLIYSIRESAFSMLYICAFTVFFGLVCKAGTSFIPILQSGLPKSLLCGFLEITNGVFSCFDLPFPMDVVVCSCVCSFAGLSVFFQIQGICQTSGLSAKLFLVSRLVCMPVSALYTLILLLIC